MKRGFRQLNYQRMVSVLLSVWMLLCLAACGSNPEKPRGTDPQNPTGNSLPTESPNDQNGEEPCEISVLTLEKELHTYYEWADDYDRALVRSEHSCVTLGQADAAAYPEMAEVLSQKAAMQENAMLEEFYNLVSAANTELDLNRDGFETYVSTLDVQVRRADSIVISLLSDSFSHYGQINNYRAFHGSNYDTQSGKELALNDVVKNVNQDLAEAVEKELTGHLWAGEFHSDSAVEDYFANTPYDGFSWTVDYAGVTFYFAPGDLCEGAMTATVSFSKHPELFYEKYMTSPAEYTVEVPMDISFFANWDTDGDYEELSVSGWYDDERNAYVDFGIYTEAGEYREDCYVYDFHPYFVKAANGNYLYLFCEDFDEGLRQMRLIVFSLNEDGSVTKSGAMNVSPSWLADNKFVVPTDPGKLALDDGAEKAVFTVGSNGMPEKT